MLFVSTGCLLNMYYNKNSYTYHEHLLEAVTWEVFFEINLNQKTLKFYTSWVHWKNQCRSTVRKHALLWNKHEYQHSAVIFVKNIFNSFPDTVLFLYFLKYIRKPEVSWYFQGALGETSAMKWVKIHLIFSYIFCYLLK